MADLGAGFGFLNPAGYANVGPPVSIVPKPPEDVATWEGYWGSENIVGPAGTVIGTGSWINTVAVAPTGHNLAQTSDTTGRELTAETAVDGSPSVPFYASTSGINGAVNIMTGTALTNLNLLASGCACAFAWMSSLPAAGDYATVVGCNNQFTGRHISLGVGENGDIFCEFIGTNGSGNNDVATFRNTTAGIAPINEWVSYFFNQPGDGSGMSAIVNGVEWPLTFDAGVSISTQDDWFDSINNSSLGINAGAAVRANTQTNVEPNGRLLGNFLEIGYTSLASLMSVPDAKSLDLHWRNKNGVS